MAGRSPGGRGHRTLAPKEAPLTTSRRMAVLTAGVLALAVAITTGQPPARNTELLNPTKNQLPTDTGSDKVTYSIEEKAELGGKALRIDFLAGDSFGDRVARIKNWKPF